jgi:magnesium-transporting ATPase (P-type)
MLYTSLYLAVFTGLSIAAVVTAVKPAIFMVPETLYVALTSSVVYSAARLPYDGFTPRYLDLLKKALPAILVLMVASAAVEAYEII